MQYKFEAGDLRWNPWKLDLLKKIEICFTVDTEAADNDQLGLILLDRQEYSFVHVTKMRQMYLQEAGTKDQQLYLTLPSDHDQRY
jgi:hypothetical protein